MFERFALRRRTRVEMAADARLFLAECVVLGRAALAKVAMVAPGTEDALGSVRAVLAGEGISAAASALEGKCVVRIMGHRALPVRQEMVLVLKVMRSRPLPRVWRL